MNHPDNLPELLQSWQPEPRPQSAFNAEVWARINAGPQLTRPGISSFWPLAVAAGVALLLGTGLGWRDARQAHAERMAAAYVRTVDPLQLTSHWHTP